MKGKRKERGEEKPRRLSEINWPKVWLVRRRVADNSYEAPSVIEATICKMVEKGAVILEGE